MKPMKHQLNLKHQKATALRISGKGRETTSIAERCEQIKLQALLGVGDPVKAFAELEKDTLIKQSVEQLSKGNLVHVDNTSPAAIVKANPKPAFSGELTIVSANMMKQVTTVPDEVPADWELEQLTPINEASLPLIAQESHSGGSTTMPGFLVKEFAKKE